MTYTEWAARHPHAAAELQQMLGTNAPPASPDAEGKSEAWSQQQVRFKATHAGVMSWRNNVGATPSKIPTCCPKCGFKYMIKQTPTRYGLANDSSKLNAKLKSSDLILAIPRLITPVMVGSTIPQFGSIEAKRPGWRYTGKGEEPGQAAWLALIASIGGYATFSTGELNL